jgi:Bax protein
MRVSIDKLLASSKRHHWMNPGILAGILIGAVVFIVILIPISLDRSLPKFSKIDNIDERKAAFFEFLNPYVDRANSDILRQRERLQSIAGNFDHGPMSRRNERWFRELAVDYGMEISPESALTRDMVSDLLERVDLIPPSMALAQAALESGWGTSRFARKGNNLYGIWCYEPGCGIVPERRPAGASYEVKKYRTPKESFEDYIHNLNTNRAYESLWQIRDSLRQEGKALTGVALSDGLYRYSQEGWGYVGKVQQVIQSNKLQHYDSIEF